MSTKTTKCGLSKANVNAIAGAIGTATLNRLVPQFSTSIAYEKGQYTNYNNQLYRFTADKSAGAWDSTKVESASLNDLINDVNDAVESVNNKANVDGNYPTMTVGLADNLTPYSEDSGAEQEQPFISQGTGCGNGTEIVTTGDYALLKEKQGNSVVANQLVKNPNFDGTTDWSITNATSSVSGGILTIQGTSSDCQVAQSNKQIYAGHKYLQMASIKLSGTPSGNVWIRFRVKADGSNNVDTQVNKNTTDWQTIFAIATAIDTTNLSSFNIRDNSASDWVTIQIKDCYLVDLTQMFNGDIPQDLLDHPENFFRYYNGSLAYNAGSLESSNGRYLVATGRNLFDGVLEKGSISVSNGQDEGNTSGNYWRSKNYIRVCPNGVINIKQSNGYNVGNANITLFLYDKNKNYIRKIDNTAGTQKTVTPDCCYVRFVQYLVTATQTAPIGITITPYYTPEQGGEGYDQYYPYEEPTVVDTGSETLRSAGNAHDYKTPDGTIHRVVGSYTFTGSETWTLYGVNAIYAMPGSGTTLNIKPATTSTAKANISFDFQADIGSISDLYDKVEFSSNNKVVAIYDGAGSIAISIALYNDRANLVGKTIYFELATETTEQGTTFPENIKINDYGMMYWLDSSNNLVGIPQGNKLFYPVNYKGFVDDVYSRTSGDASNIVIQSELSASETARDAVDTQLQNAIGGTLRQLLVSQNSGLSLLDTAYLDLGSAIWTKGGTSFSTTAFASLLKIPASNETPKLLASGEYMIPKSANAVSGVAGSYEIYITPQGQIVWYYPLDAYATAEDFIAGMKGVLLAYEKA